MNEDNMERPRHTTLREDENCLMFIDSLSQNHKLQDDHMWQKYLGIGVAFVLGNTMDAEAGRPHVQLQYLIEKFFIYPPGGAAGRKAAYEAMRHT